MPKKTKKSIKNIKSNYNKKGIQQNVHVKVVAPRGAKNEKPISYIPQYILPPPDVGFQINSLLSQIKLELADKLGKFENVGLPAQVPLQQSNLPGPAPPETPIGRSRTPQ